MGDTPGFMRRSLCARDGCSLLVGFIGKGYMFVESECREEAKERRRRETSATSFRYSGMTNHCITARALKAGMEHYHASLLPFLGITKTEYPRIR